MLGICGFRYWFWFGCSSHRNWVCVRVEQLSSFVRTGQLRRPWRGRRRDLEPAGEILCISVLCWTRYNDMWRSMSSRRSGRLTSED